MSFVCLMKYFFQYDAFYNFHSNYMVFRCKAFTYMSFAGLLYKLLLLQVINIKMIFAEKMYMYEGLGNLIYH
jgi:hypothetical protein